MQDLVNSPSEAWHDLLSLSSLLIDGPFHDNERDLSLAFRGSRNQRIIDVGASLQRNEPVVVSDRFDSRKKA